MIFELKNDDFSLKLFEFLIKCRCEPLKGAGAGWQVLARGHHSRSGENLH